MARSSPRSRRRARWLPLAYLVAGLVAAFGGARPTGLGWLDPVLLGVGGAAVAACAVRSRTIAVFVACGLAGALQPATAPLLLAGLGMAAAFSRRWQRHSALAGVVAGGLGWAGMAGVPGEPGSRFVVVPLAAFGSVAWSAWHHGSRRFRRRFEVVAGVGGGVLVLFTVLGALSVVTARSHVERGADLLQSGLDAAREGDAEGAVADLRSARRALRRGEATLGALWARPAWLVPGVSQNARTLHRLAEEVGDLAEVGVSVAEEADLESLRARGGRVDLAAVAAVEEPLHRLRAGLEVAGAQVAPLGDAFLLPPVRSAVDEAAAEIADAIPSVDLAIQGSQVAPGLLGADGPRTYLVLFTTPVEARATSGFPGNYAEVTFTDGRFEMTRFGRISELNEALPPGGGTVSGPEDYLRRYGRFGVTREWRNLTLSPDFPSVAAVAGQLYPQAGGRPVDGVLTVDPDGLAALLRFTGPVAVPGVRRPLTFRNAAEFLLRDQYLSFPDTPDRIDALEALAQATFDRLTAVELPGPRELGRVLGPVVGGKHLQVFAFGDAEGRFLDEIGLTGRWPAVSGDFVGVTTSNASASKIELFLRRSLDYAVQWDPSTGAVSATATITLHNDAPASGLPHYVIGNALGARLGEEELPLGWSNLFVTLYTPFDADSATLDGEPLALERLDELDRHALSAYVPIPPGGTRTIEVTLSGTLPGPRYVLDLGAQPLVEPETATVTIDVAGADGGGSATGGLRPEGGAWVRSWPLVEDTRLAVGR